MAHVVEIAFIEAVEGKFRAEQIDRLKEWKKHFLGQGAEKVIVYSVGAGNLNADWVFEIHHKSGTSYGQMLDDYYKSPKSHDDVMEAWQKKPVLKINTYSVVVQMDDL